jgi:hypothetical protein
VLDFAGRCAEENVGDEAMAMRAHRDEIAAFRFDPLDYFGRRIAIG